MTVAVEVAAALPAYSPLARWALPGGFPFLVVVERMEIIEPVLVHLQKKHVIKAGGRSRWKKNTAEAEAYDLRDWFDYLEHVDHDGRRGKPWDLATYQDYLDYRDVLQDIVSRQTGRHFGDSTIRRRQIAVESFYNYAIAAGLYVGRFIEEHVVRGRYRPPRDVDPLAHIRSNGGHEKADPEGLNRAAANEPVRPLTPHEWTILKLELGPLPSEQGEQDPRSCRSRTATELSVDTGMRCDEVASLTAAQVRDLISSRHLLPEHERETTRIELRLHKTKGLVPRDVLVPAYLVAEMERYMDGERAESIKVGRAYAAEKGEQWKEPRTFFLNQPAIPRQGGKPVTTDSLQADFRNACIAAGLVRTETRYDPDDPERVTLVKVSAHSYHDTRHSFAVWSYHAETKAGNREPWKPIQILLGHTHLQTTTDTYLKVVDIHRKRAGRQQWENTRKLREPHHG